MTVLLAGLLALATMTMSPAAASGAPGLPAPAPAAATSLQPALDAVVRSGAVHAIARLRAGGERWAGASGVADLRTGRPAPANGRFRIGSVTKTFVATVVLQLVGEGRIGLDDPIERHLPGLIPNGGAVTVRHLLNHTSGVFNYTEDQQALPLRGEAFLTRTRFRTFTEQELVTIATSHDPYFAPGTGFHYDNTGYLLAGMLIERVTGNDYGDEIRRRILRPLGLRHTSVPGTSTRIPGPHAHGYLPIERDGTVRLVDVTRLNPSWAGAAGEMLSTTEDLNRFFAALLGGRLLRPAELAVMKTEVANDGRVGYGMALWRQPRPCGVTVWGHGGNIHGYKTTSVHSEDGTRQLTVAYSPTTNGIDEALATEALIDAAFCDRAG